jgi:serine protease inhibitor
MQMHGSCGLKGLRWLLLLAACTALSGCGGGESGAAASNSGGVTSGATSSGASVSTSSAPAAVVKAEQANTAVDPQLVAADNAFGLNLLNQLTTGATGNVAIAPISVGIALQILYNGAGGSTQTDLAQTLQLGGLSVSVLNNDNAALQASLITADPSVQLTIANSLWMHLSNNPVLPAFSSMDETYYGATIGDLSGAPDNVNAWVAAATNGLITQILPTQSAGYYQTVIAVLANAIYFKGPWTTAFDASQTAPAPFTLSDGSQVSAEMMNQTGSFDYFQGSLQGTSFQALRLPYGSGRLNMLLVLPDAQTPISSFVSGISAATLTRWNSQFQKSTLGLSLPRFTATYGQSLNAALSSLGMGSLFCPLKPDLSGISALLPPCIDDVEHKTVVEVDETGTVAAGATTITVGVAVVAGPGLSMTINHPFFYAIQDGQTGELLFVGVLMNPS